MNHIEAKEAVKALAEWSLNYDYPTPMNLYMDLIGYSEDEYGEKLCGDKQPSIGYLEADLLGKALIAYADAPGAALDAIEEIIKDETEEEDD